MTNSEATAPISDRKAALLVSIPGFVIGSSAGASILVSPESGLADELATARQEHEHLLFARRIMLEKLTVSQPEAVQVLDDQIGQRHTQIQSLQAEYNPRDVSDVLFPAIGFGLLASVVLGGLMARAIRRPNQRSVPATLPPPAS